MSSIGCWGKINWGSTYASKTCRTKRLDEEDEDEFEFEDEDELMMLGLIKKAVSTTTSAIEDVADVVSDVDVEKHYVADDYYMGVYGCSYADAAACTQQCSILRQHTGSYFTCMTAVNCYDAINWFYSERW